MEKIFTGLHWKILFIYLDDMVVYGKSFIKELSTLCTVFQRLRDANLKLKPKKCQLFRSQVIYLDHVIWENGIKTEPEKRKAFEECQAPKCVSEVRSFLGLTSYYRRFIKKYADIAQPLTELTQKNHAFLGPQNVKKPLKYWRESWQKLPS